MVMWSTESWHLTLLQRNGVDSANVCFQTRQSGIGGRDSGLAINKDVTDRPTPIMFYKIPWDFRKMAPPSLKAKRNATRNDLAWLCCRGQKVNIGSSRSRRDDGLSPRRYFINTDALPPITTKQNSSSEWYPERRHDNTPDLSDDESELEDGLPEAYGSGSDDVSPEEHDHGTWNEMASYFRNWEIASSNQGAIDTTGNGQSRPHMATNYDVDSEHQYIMDKALRSYREHRAKEPDTGSSASERAPHPPSALSPTSTSALADVLHPPQPLVKKTRRVQSATLHVSVPCLTSISGPTTSYSACTSTSSLSVFHSTGADARAEPCLTSVRPATAQPRLSDVGRGSYVCQQTSTNALRPTFQKSVRSPPATTLGYGRDAYRAHSGASRRVLPRSQVPPSMDRTRLNKGTEPKRQGQGHRQVEGSFFSSTRPKRQYFSIHPEWVSENFSVHQMSISQRMTSNGSHSPERRCYSAPPPRTRNPITWENPDMNELRLRDARLRASSRGRSTTRPKSEVMDAIGCGSDRDQKVPKFNIRSTFFTTTNSPRRQYFTIHPEWQSESGQIRKQVVYQQQATVYPMRRCKSAPPPRTRNPITWDYADRPDRR